MTTENKKTTVKTATSTKKANNIAPENKSDVVEKKIKKISKIDDSVLVKVKSTCNGQLYYKNSRTQDSTEWSSPGEIQIMSMGDLRAMKAEHISFFKNHWIVLLGVADGCDCEATCEDLYNALIVTKYYENYVEPTDYAEISSWDEATIEERVGMLSDGAKENLAVTINKCIESGAIDSIRRIKAFEKALGCKLYGNDN